MRWLSHSAYPSVMSSLAALKANGQRFCRRFPVATSHEGRTIYGLRIHRGGDDRKRAVLIVGGAHAREMAPPEAVLLFAIRVCLAYAAGKAFSFGGKKYSAGVAARLIEGLELLEILCSTWMAVSGSKRETRCGAKTVVRIRTAAASAWT